VTIPNSVTRIENNTFYCCTSLTSITIPNSVTSIGSEAFSYCTSLASVALSNSITNIARGLFRSCTSLTKVKIPGRVTSIGDDAFHDCINLTTVTILGTVSNIGLSAFSSCTGLKGVYFRGNNGLAGLIFANWVLLDATNATVYYLPGTTGWGGSFGSRPTARWKPVIETSDASFGVRTNRFGFTIAWADDRAVVVEATMNLANPAWIPVSTNTLPDGISYFSDPQWTSPARFYRLRSP